MAAATIEATTEEVDLQVTLKRYKAYFETIDGYNNAITQLDGEVTDAEIAVEEQKIKLSKVREQLRDLEDMREAAQKSLLRFLNPKNREELPLFDQMDDADEEVHGVNAADWRTEPINALRISPKSIELLNGADILLVGQLQDKMLDGDQYWWKSIDGLSEAVAAAIADGMSEFINRRSKSSK
jgi:hypothetical protein